MSVSNTDTQCALPCPYFLGHNSTAFKLLFFFLISNGILLKNKKERLIYVHDGIHKRTKKDYKRVIHKYKETE